MKHPASLPLWQFGIAPGIAGAATAMFFVLANFSAWASATQALFAFAAWFARDFVLAMLLAVPASAFMRSLGVGPLWYWVCASALGMPMGAALADPLMEWHPTPEQVDAGFQTHTMLVYALLFGVGAFAYGMKIKRHDARSDGHHAV